MMNLLHLVSHRVRSKEDENDHVRSPCLRVFFLADNSSFIIKDMVLNADMGPGSRIGVFWFGSVLSWPSHIAPSLCFTSPVSGLEQTLPLVEYGDNTIPKIVRFRPSFLAQAT